MSTEAEWKAAVLRATNRYAVAEAEVARLQARERELEAALRAPVTVSTTPDNRQWPGQWNDAWHAARAAARLRRAIEALEGEHAAE